MSGSSLPYPFDLSAPGAVDALLAFHRAVFGGARMEADDEGGQPDEQQGEQKPPEKEPEPRGDSDGLGDAGRKAIAAERKAAREEKRRADEAQAQLEELRRQQMTEQERAVAERDDARKQLEEANARLAAFEQERTRNEVAAAKGLSLAQARRLSGTTREEFEADADAFKAELAALAAPPVPKPDPSAGAVDSGKPSSVADAIRAYQARSARSGT